MKATIIDTHHTIKINDLYIDLFYQFEQRTIQVFVNGEHYTTSQFHPARNILSYTNVIDTAVVYYEAHIKKLKALAQQTPI